MKHLPSAKLSDKVRIWIKAHWLRTILTVLWLISVGFFLSQPPQAPTQIPTTQVCLLANDVIEGEKLTASDIKTAQFPSGYIPEHTISDCSQSQLFEVPLAVSLQKGDLLQLSALETSDARTQFLGKKLANKQEIFYFTMKDLHSFPAGIKTGQRLNLYGKSKKAENAVLMLAQGEVVDLNITKNLEDKEQLYAIGMSMSQEKALLFTEAVADEWTIEATLAQ
jgi:hypothetical protein